MKDLTGIIRVPYSARTGMCIRIKKADAKPRLLDRSGNMFKLVLHDADGLGSGGPDEALYEVGQRVTEDHNITTKNGLLWRDGEVIPLPRADAVAREHGFQYAEQLVKALESKTPGYPADRKLPDGTLIDIKTTKPAGPPVHWPAVIGKLLAALQTAGFSVDRVDDGEVTLLASGTPRQRRQQVKNVVVNSDLSHITASVSGRKLWLCVDLDKKPCECVTDYSDDGDLEAVIKYFHSYFA